MSPATPVMSPETPAMGTATDRPLLALVGSCGHTIDVLVGNEPADAAAVKAALEAGEQHARLTRFCPICVEDRFFRLPLAEQPPNPTPGRSEPVLKSPVLEREVSHLRSLETIPPVERAYQLWEGSRDQELDQAEQMLRNAAAIFDHQGRFMEHRGVLEELTKRLSAGGHHKKADKLRRQLAQPLR